MVKQKNEFIYWETSFKETKETVTTISFYKYFVTHSFLKIHCVLIKQ